MGADDASQGSGSFPLTILAIVGTGLGGLAFFTFMGGAITVARFRGAGLSGTKAVALVPKSDLLASGAQALLLPILVGAAVLIPFAYCAHDRKRRRIVLIGLGIAGLLVGIGRIAAAWPVGDWTAEERWAVAALFVIAILGGLAVDGLARDRPASSQGEQAGRGGGARRKDTSGETASVGASAGPADGGVKPGPLPAVESAAHGQTGLALHWRSWAHATALLFLVVAAFVAVAGYGLGYAHPTVHSMAVLRSRGLSGLSGIYVGESNSRVWIGQVRLSSPESDHGVKQAGRIIELPRSEVTDIAIGASLPLNDAVSNGPRLLETLEKERSR